MTKEGDELINKYGTTTMMEAVHTPGVFAEIDAVTFDIVSIYAASMGENVMDMRTGAVIPKKSFQAIHDNNPKTEESYKYVIISKMFK